MSIRMSLPSPVSVLLQSGLPDTVGTSYWPPCRIIYLVLSVFLNNKRLLFALFLTLFRSLLHIDDLPDISDEEKSLDEDLFATAPPLDEENMHQLMQSGRVDEMFYEPASAPQVEEIEPLLPQIPTHAPAMSSSSSRAPTAPSKSSSAARSSSSHSSQPLSQPVRPPVPPSSISVPPVEPLPPHYYNVPASQVAPQQRSQTPRGLQPPPQHQSRAVQPHAPHRFVQPRISEDMYRARFRHWIESLWWAPRG